MDAVTGQALEKLLRKAERKTIKAGNGPTPSLKFTQASLPAYNVTMTHDRLSTIHAELRDCACTGAIDIDWDRRAGEGGQIERICLADGRRLASYLGQTPRWDTRADAESAIAAWRGRWRVEPIWARWQLDKSVRSIRVDRYNVLVDACRVLDHLPHNQDVPARRLSAQLFQDSKRIERDLPTMLDELTRDSDLLTSDSQLVLQRLGLVKHPQPLLLAGRGQIRMTDGVTADLQRPYIGVAPDHFLGLADAAPGHVLTIENLTTFNEVARSLTGAEDAVVVYTAGMPSPALRAALRTIFADCDDQTCFWHWGDVDVGGLRIALAVQAELAGRAVLKPWQMDLSGLPHEALVPAATQRVVQQMTGLAQRLAWPEVALGISQKRATVEQEILAPSCPF